jgi:ethanolaminephosphotransferase
MTSTYIGIILFYDRPDLIVWVWVCAFSPFYFATWEEYHVGVLDLPMINGVSDGCILVGLVITFIGWLGHAAWKAPWILGLAARDWSFVFFGSAAFLTCLQNVLNVRAHRNSSIYEMVQTSLAYLLIMTNIGAFKLCSPSHILTNDYVSTIAFLGFIFAKE